jgi:hypothetical protein
MNDEAGRDITLGEGDDVIEGKRIAIDHPLVNILGDIVGLEDGAILLVDGLAAGKEEGDKEQREKTEAFHDFRCSAER